MPSLPFFAMRLPRQLAPVLRPSKPHFRKAVAVLVRQKKAKALRLASLLLKAVMISGNAGTPILMLDASYAATRRPPGGGLALEVARGALVSFGSQREVVEVAEPAAAAFAVSESFSILAASLNAEDVQGVIIVLGSAIAAGGADAVAARP